VKIDEPAGPEEWPAGKIPEVTGSCVDRLDASAEGAEVADVSPEVLTRRPGEEVEEEIGAVVAAEEDGVAIGYD
jgi:hypothetical protein